MDEERSISLLKYKRLHNSIDEVQKIVREFTKSIQHHHLELLEMGRLYTSIKSRHVVDQENVVKCNVIKQKTSFNPEDQNNIIKIKGSGLGSLTTNQNKCKNDTNPGGST